MDESTKDAATNEAFRHLLVDLERATRRQNQLIGGFMLLLLFWSVAAVFLFLKLDRMQVITNLIG